MNQLAATQYQSGPGAGLGPVFTAAVFTLAATATLGLAAPLLAASEANRLTYLDDFADPFQPSAAFPKLVTPQWVGEPGVEVVVTYGIDDMRGHTNYETYLRPLLERLKRIDGRAPVSIFCNAPNPEEPHLQQWLKEGLSLEVHTLSHPCPILGQGNFIAAANTFHGCVDLLNRVPGNQPVAFRTPCCDSIDSASPRLFAELFARTNSGGQFLRLDSSVGMLFTTNDPALPPKRLRDTQGHDRFRKYIPFPAFTTFIENYPYPYIHTRLCWEMPFVIPSDWESSNLQGPSHPGMLEDWKVALDLVAGKQGVFNFIFHPANWSSPTQHVAFVDYATSTYGTRVKFLNYREVDERLTRHLLAGQPLRDAHGKDNGVRLIDLDHDGYLDVVIANDTVRQTRLWDPRARTWSVSGFPAFLVRSTLQDAPGPADNIDEGVRFGILGDAAQPIALVHSEGQSGAWRFREGHWHVEPDLLRGLELDGKPVLTSRNHHDQGVRLRDVDGDGVCELIVANPSQAAVFAWDGAGRSWKRVPYTWPSGVTLVDAQGQDNGLRFLDLNGDGLDDLIFSNDQFSSIHLMVPRQVLGFQPGWSREVLRAARGQAPELPPIVRAAGARNNGAWFTRQAMFVQNEDTARFTNLVVTHPFPEMLAGFMPAALDATQSMACIKLPTNFVVELVAQEPLIEGPVHFDWGEDGRLWVVEMRDYPLGLDGRGKPGGRVRVLEDTDGDGRYDKSTLFADGLNFPNGLMPWRKGVLISAAPDILYAEDTDGDGRADRVEKIFSGFGEGNQQHRCNGFEYGLDNWLYGANGDSGGQIHAAGAQNRGSTAISISGRDFRFRPDTGLFETVAGQTQYGRHRDDWGNWFGNANPIWLWHYWLPEHYLRRNPRLIVESVRRETASYADAGRVHSIGRKLQRLNDVGTAGFVTSANSPTPCRDDLFGPEFARAVFISEPVYNSIRCEILEPDGVTFRSRRWHPDEPSEFLASTDPWSRPTGLRIGPDGALYFADMYRQFIEHPEWIPDDIKTRFNMRAGEDRGRLYRVYPRGATLRRPPRLDRLTTLELVAALDHPNGWQRDTVQRLLVTRGDRAAVPTLRALARNATSPKTRVQALSTLEGLAGLREEDLTRLLEDPHPQVREHATRVSEGLLARGAAGKLSAPFLKALLGLADDPELRVRYQLAFSLGEWADPRAATALARIALHDPAPRELQIAVASSAARDPDAILMALLNTHREMSGLDRLVRDLLTGIAWNRGEPPGLITALGRPDKEDHLEAWQVGAFSHLLRELNKSGAPWRLDVLASRELATARHSARSVAEDPARTLDQRLAALELSGQEGGVDVSTLDWLVSLLSPQTPDALQRAALHLLGESRSAALPVVLLRNWLTHSPSVRRQALDILFRREEWIRTLLEHLETHKLAIEDLGTGARQRLLSHPIESVRRRAAPLLAQRGQRDRQKLIDEYLPAVRTAQGDAAHGAPLFAQHCAVCHPLGQRGNGVAPDLASVVDRSPERMLVAILDPSRAVEDRYVNYLARTRQGDEYSGILSGENANSITLISAGGIAETLLRSDVASLTSTRLSLMPEGFEQALKPQDMADLLAHINALATPPRTFPGNQPALVRPDGSGALHLEARLAEIHGDGIVFETHYRNLGFWNNVEARAVWTLQIPTSGSYEVWLRWACPEDESGDRFRFQAGEASVVGKITGTGTWDHYDAAKVGRIDLPSGETRAVLRAEAPLRGYLADVLEVRLVPVGAPDPRFEAMTLETRK